MAKITLMDDSKPDDFKIGSVYKQTTFNQERLLVYLGIANKYEIEEYYRRILPPVPALDKANMENFINVVIHMEHYKFLYEANFLLFKGQQAQYFTELI